MSRSFHNVRNNRMLPTYIDATDLRNVPEHDTTTAVRMKPTSSTTASPPGGEWSFQPGIAGVNQIVGRNHTGRIHTARTVVEGDPPVASGWLLVSADRLGMGQFGRRCLAEIVVGCVSVWKRHTCTPRNIVNAVLAMRSRDNRRFAMGLSRIEHDALHAPNSGSVRDRRHKRPMLAC